MVTSGMSSASSRSAVTPPGGTAGPRRATAAASASTSAGNAAGISNSARMRANASANGETAAGARTTGAGIVRPADGRAGVRCPRAHRVGVVAVDERARVVGRVAHGDEIRPAERGGLAPRRGEQLGMRGLEELAAEEHHRTADAVQRQAVLRTVGEDLLLGSRATRCVHDAGARDGEEPVLADAVREVLGDVRGEAGGRLVDVHPCRNAEALASVGPSPPDLERGFHVRVGIGRRIRCRRERGAHRRGRGRPRAPSRRRDSRLPSRPGRRRSRPCNPARVKLRPSRATSRYRSVSRPSACPPITPDHAPPDDATARRPRRSWRRATRGRPRRSRKSTMR